MERAPAVAVAEGDEKVVLYVVVRQSLKLVGGKIGAQVGHAIMFVVEDAACEHRYQQADVLEKAIASTRTVASAAESDDARQRRAERHLLYKEWRAGEYGKIVLAASDEDFLLVKERYGTSYLVIDNGHTQVDPNTETCVGIWPMRKKDRCELLLRLKPLR